MVKETVVYSKNQYIENELVLVANIPYELKLDIAQKNFFVVNQNNEIIYLKKLKAIATVSNKEGDIFTTVFSNNEYLGFLC